MHAQAPARTNAPLVSVTTLETASPLLTTLGYVVIPRTSALEVPARETIAAFTAAGWAEQAPSATAPEVAMHEALRGWAKDAGLHLAGRGKAKRCEVKKLTPEGKDYHVYFLEAREADLAKLRMSWATSLRVFLYKDEQQGFLVTRDGEGDTDVTLRAGDLEVELAARYRMLRERVKGQAFGRTVYDVLGSLGGVRLKDDGGCLFVPAAAEADLVRLAALVEALPKLSGRAHILRLPVYDLGTARADLAESAHLAIMTEIDNLGKYLDLFATGKTGKTTREGTVAEMLKSYQQEKARVRLYHDILGMRQAEAEERLARLARAAQALLERDAAAFAAGEEEGAGEVDGDDADD